MPKRKEDESVLKYRQLTYGDCTREEDLKYLAKKSKIDQVNLLKELSFLHTMTSSLVPLMFQLLESDIPVKFKMIVYKKILALEKEQTGKLHQWVDAFLRIPFQKDIPLTITFHQIDKCHAFMKECETILDRCTYGMHDAKQQFLQLIGKWVVNPASMGTAIALKGPMGTGKTTLIKIILDLLDQDNGEVQIFGVSRVLPKSREKLCYLPEKFSPSPHLKGEEFVKFVLDFYKKKLEATSL
jgi:hypothetical protein